MLLHAFLHIFSTHFLHFILCPPPILDACSLILNLVGPSTLSLLRDRCFDLSGVAILAVPADSETSERGSFNKVLPETDEVPVIIYEQMQLLKALLAMGPCLSFTSKMPISVNLNQYDASK